jgi:replication factor A2
MVDGKELSQLVFVGRVNKVTVSPSNIQYVIDDGTGSVDVRQYTDMEEDEQRPTFGEGCIVRVVGQVKRFNSKKSVTVYKIFQIESLDEYAHHFLSAIVTHLGLTKPRPVGVYHFDKKTNTVVNPLQQSFGQTSFTNSHLNPLQQQIMKTLSQSTNEVTGGNINDVIMRLRGMANESKIKYYVLT